jgi:hypothetical protein
MKKVSGKKKPHEKVKFTKVSQKSSQKVHKKSTTGSQKSSQKKTRKIKIVRDRTGLITSNFYLKREQARKQNRTQKTIGRRTFASFVFWQGLATFWS